MTQINTILINNNLREIFGELRNHNCLESEMINTITRYLALNRSCNNLEGIKDNIPFIREIDYHSQYTPETIINYMREEGSEDITIWYEDMYRYKIPDTIWNFDFTNEGYIELNTASNPINQYLSAFTKTRVLINEQQKRTLIIAGQINNEWGRKMLSTFPKIMPWIFTESIPEDEMKLLKALSDNDFDTINSLVEAKYNEFDFRTILFHKEFDGYENSYIENQKEILQSRLRDNYDSYRAYQEHLSQILLQIKENNIEYDALCKLDLDTSNNFANFLINHKNIVYAKKRRDNTIYYVVDETIEYYDVDKFENYYNNSRCGFMTTANEITKKVLKGLFIDCVGKLSVYSEFQLNNLTSIDPLRAGTIESVRYDDHFAHPHLGEYVCLGGNRNQINDYLSKGDWDMAIEQTIAATKNLNFGDSTVMCRLVERLNMNSTRKGIIADNGKRMSPKEFAKYVETLEKKEAKKKEKKADEQTN